jgi:hypothetical protein
MMPWSKACVTTCCPVNKGAALDKVGGLRALNSRRRGRRAGEGRLDATRYGDPRLPAARATASDLVLA